MADGIEKFSWSANVAKVTNGWSDGGGQFSAPNLAPEMTIVDGTGPGVDEKLHVGPVVQGKVQDVWNSRRANGN